MGPPACNPKVMYFWRMLFRLGAKSDDREWREQCTAGINSVNQDLREPRRGLPCVGYAGRVGSL